LVQALLNLVMNAILYSPEHTTVTLQVRKEGRMISFAIIDHGVGIAKEDQERIFERFYRWTKQGPVPSEERDLDCPSCATWR
jgi:two-component system sensor histidine kinase SenX3